MTKDQCTTKENKLKELRKSYKHHVIHADAATKINHIRELIENLENELKKHKNNI